MDANLPLPLTGEVLISSANSSDKARLDVSARGFWQRGKRTFFDVRVLQSVCKESPQPETWHGFLEQWERQKATLQPAIIEVEHGSFSSLVFSSYGGNGREAERSLTELAQKKQMGYSIVIHWLRVKLYFNLLRSAVLCLRGSRTTKHELNADFSKAEIANVIGKIK